VGYTKASQVLGALVALIARNAGMPMAFNARAAPDQVATASAARRRLAGLCRQEQSGRHHASANSSARLAALLIG